RAAPGAPLVDDPDAYGWAVGAGGTILGSKDYGQTWRVYTPSLVSEAPHGVGRTSRTEAIAAGANDRAPFTVAPPRTPLWMLATPVDRADFQAVSAPGIESVNVAAWAAGKLQGPALPTIQLSEDGGTIWTSQLLPSTAPLTGNGLNDIFFLDELRGWAV